MSKQEFLSQLAARLSGMPREDLDERLGFYNEMIDDRIEEGLSEEEAVAEMGSIDDVVSQILADYPLSKIVKEKVKPKRSLRAWEIVLLIIGAPIWLSLLFAALAVILSVYIVLWSLIITLWAINLSFALTAVAGVAGAVVLASMGQGLAGLALFGAALLFAGLTIFLFFGCKAATKGIVRLTKIFALWIKSLFIGKDGKHEQNS